MPSTTRRTTRQTIRHKPRQTALETTSWTFHPTVTDATDTKKGIIDKGALECCDYCDNEKAALWCRECGEARYCSAECSDQNRFQHGKVCASAQGQFHLSKRPECHVRGVLFDINSHKPSFIWLDTTDFPLSVAQALGVKVEEVQPPSDINSDIPHRRMHHGVQEFYPHRCSRSEGQEITQFNKSIATLSRPGLMRFRYCSILYSGFRLSKSGKSIVYEDITMKDFRAIIDYLQLTTTYPNPIIVDLKRYPFPTTANPKEKFRPWPAVKVNCHEDVQRLSCLSEGNKWATVEDIFVPPVSKTEHLYLPSLCGLPWIGEFLADDELAPKQKRNYAGRIFTHVPIQGKDGEQHQSLDAYCGSLYIVHADGAPIHPNHILAFISFTEKALAEIETQKGDSSTTGLGHESYGLLLSSKQLRPLFTMEKFSKFWAQWISNPETVKMTYKHNVDGCEWYPFGPFFEEAIPWCPYAFAPMPRITFHCPPRIRLRYTKVNFPYEIKYDFKKREYHEALKDVFNKMTNVSMW
ncbi:hypothetical protein F5Y05DRAFT_389058 [Hypoxylon sp. FL0543]|nr:hypothetical protein F5Y05DRAFT_389058 [Hypoxylon sp. FL0543]